MLEGNFSRWMVLIITVQNTDGSLLPCIPPTWPQGCLCDFWSLKPPCTYVFYIVWMFHYLFSIKVLPVLRVLLRTQAVFFPFLWNRQSSSFHFAVCDLYFSVCMCLLVQFGGHGKYVCEKILLWCTFSNSFCSFGSQYHTLYKSYFGNNTFKEFLH